MNNLDAQFITKCFTAQGDVAVDAFIQECQNAIQGDKAQALPIIRQLASMIAQQNIQINNVLA